MDVSGSSSDRRLKDNITPIDHSKETEERAKKLEEENQKMKQDLDAIKKKLGIQ